MIFFLPFLFVVVFFFFSQVFDVGRFVQRNVKDVQFLDDSNKAELTQANRERWVVGLRHQADQNQWTTLGLSLSLGTPPDTKAPTPKDSLAMVSVNELSNVDELLSFSQFRQETSENFLRCR